MTTLSVDIDIADDEDLLGKVVGDLQNDITIGSNYIAGTLNYLDDYTGFSSIAAEQSGHYLALHFEVPDVEGVTIKVKVTKEVTLDEDGIIVLRIVDPQTQTITVTASKEGYDDVVRTFSLRDLELEEA